MQQLSIREAFRQVTFWNSLEGSLRYAAAALGVPQLPRTDSWSARLSALDGPRFARHRRQIASLVSVDEAKLRELCPQFRTETVARTIALAGGHWEVSPDPDSVGLKVIVRSARGAAALAQLSADEASCVRSLHVDLVDEWSAETSARTWSELHRLGRFSNLRALEVTGSGTVGSELVTTVPDTVEELALYNVRWDDAGHAALARLPRLRCLTVMHRKFDVAKLAALPQLESVLFENTGAIDKDGLEALARMKSLRRLHLRHNRLGKEVAALAALADLVELDLEGNPVDDAAGTKLAKLPHLRILRLGDTKVGAKTCAAIGASRTLQEIDLKQVAKASLADVSASQTLLALHIAHTPFDEDGLRSLSRIRTLRFLLMAHPKARGVFELVQSLPELDALHVRGGSPGPLPAPLSVGEIDLSRTDVDEQVLRGVFGPSLRSASLGRVPIPQSVLEDKASELPHLEVLTLNTNGLTDRAFETLGSAKRLRILFSIDNRIERRGIAALASLPALEWVSLQGDGVDGASFTTLCTNRALRRVHVSGEIGDTALDALHASRHLRELHLEEGHGATSKAVDRLRDALPDCLVRA